MVQGCYSPARSALSKVRSPRIRGVYSNCLVDYSSDDPAVESLEYGPEVALGIGYGESKWVAEQVLHRAGRSTGLRTVSVRVGQLSGDSRSGAWNAKEWVPTLVRTGARLGALPAKDCVSALRSLIII